MELKFFGAKHDTCYHGKQFYITTKKDIGRTQCPVLNSL